MKFYRPFRYIYRHHLQTMGRQWLVLVVTLGALVVLLYGGNVMAAPVNQTVPPPTPTREDTPVPTATSRPSNNDDDDQNQSPTVTPLPPTATPMPEGLQASVAVVRLNVRGGPGTTFPVIGVVVNGQTVQVLERNEAGDWWKICCLPGTTSEGWVSAQFLQPAFDRGQANTLVPVAEELPEVPTPTTVPTVDPNATVTASLAEGIVFDIQQDPLYIWQGQEFSLVYQIVNTTITDTTNLELRNELPVQLQFVAIEEADGGVVITETTEISTTSFTIDWPTFDAATDYTVRVRVQAAEDLTDGSVIDNLAVLVADGFSAITSGITIGMPPTELPEFR